MSNSHLLRPNSYAGSSPGGNPGRITGDDTKNNKKRSSFSSNTRTAIVFKCMVVACIFFGVVNNVSHSQDVLHRSLACQKQTRRLRATDAAGNYEEYGGTGSSPGSGSYLNSFMQRTRRLLATAEDGAGTAEDGEEVKCNLLYPETVGEEVGLDYYAPPDLDSGIYYQEEAPIAEQLMPPTGDDDAAISASTSINIDTENVDPNVLVPDVDEPLYYTNVDTALLDAFVPKEYDPVSETSRPTDTTAFAVSLISCPDTYTPESSDVTDPGAYLYEASAICKSGVCNIFETAETSTTERRQLQEEGSTTVSGGGYTMYALVHPDAINCRNPDGTFYNRVQLLQQQGYHVEIVGQPITNIDLNATQPYIGAHIEEDVGVRDSLTLHAFNLEEHKAVILLDYSMQIQNPFLDEINDFITTPSDEVRFVKDKDGGVSRTFMMIKPSREKFEEIRQEYMNTPYDPTTGWDGEGHNTFEGKMGLKGFFSYKASKDPKWAELDRCTYNNQLDDACIAEKDVDDSVIVRHSKNVCGEPRDCPYDHPLWSPEKKLACNKSHANYFKARMEFEEKYLLKPKTQERVGQFKDRAFKGYCKGPGKKNYLGMTRAIYRKPEWQVTCDKATCPTGTFLKNDCTCTEPDSPCDACPENTRCQLTPELQCIDCNCGFCDSAGASCCEFNGANTCRSGLGSNNDCVMQKDFFPAFGGSGNICSDINFQDTVTANGCSCKPSGSMPCSYNAGLQGSFGTQCYVCTTEDLALGFCPDCIQCLETCDSCITNASASVDDHKQCLQGMSNSCRASCDASCKKS